MTELLDDTMLLAALGEVLAPEPAAPGADAMAALYRALDDRAAAAVAVATAQDGLAPVVPLVAAGRWAQRGGTLHRLRHPVAAVVATAVLATSGMAAAAVATDHLPGPTRAVAFDLGLPVTSPALAAARGTLAQLEAALAAGDVVRARATADLLHRELAALSPSDRAAVEAQGAVALARVGELGGAPTGGAAGDGPATADGGTSVAGGVGGGSGSSSSTSSHDDAGGGGAGESSGSGTTAGTAGGSDDGSTATTSTTGDGSATGAEDNSGSTTSTATPGGTTSTTGTSGSGGSDDGSTGDGSSDDKAGSTDHAIAPTPTTRPPTAPGA